MRNIILLCLDTVRKDYFDRFAPRLQERADTIYQQARAASSWSVPSHASIFSGELPHVHGVHTHSRQFTQIDQSETFIAHLPEYTHIGVSANGYASRAYGFDSFFDIFDEIHFNEFQFGNALSPKDLDLSKVNYLDYLSLALRNPQPVQSLANGILAKYNPYEFLFSERPWPEIKDNGTKRTLSKAKAHIAAEESSNRLVFAFLNLMEAHSPMYHHREYNRDLHSVSNTWSSRNRSDGMAYDISFNTEKYSQYLNNWRQLYAASIDYLDRKIDDWIDTILRNTENDTTIVITSDHGQNLGTEADNHLFGHSGSLSEGLLHVPLIIINPPKDYPKVEHDIVSHLDLGQLLISLAHDEEFQFNNDPIPAEVIGHSGSLPVRSKLSYWDRLIRCVYKGSEKIEWDSLGRTKMFELSADAPCSEIQVDSTTNSPPDLDELLFKTNFLDAKQMAVQEELNITARGIDVETKKRLADLGYM